MSFTGYSSEKSMLSYDFGRWTGQASGGQDIDFNGLAKNLDCSRDLFQAGIIYDDGNKCWLVRPSRRIATNTQSSVSHVVITKIDQTAHLHNTGRAVVKSVSSPSLVTEITSTAFACGGFIVTIFLSATATAAIPFTAGASGIIAAVGVAGSAATVAQCFIGTGRLIAMTNGYDKQLAWLDSQDWYVATSTALDLLSLAGAGAGLKGTIDSYKAMKAVSSRNVFEWFQTLSRAERKRITENIIRAQNPGISNSGVKAAMEAGRYPKRFPTEAIQHQLQRELLIAINNTVTFAGSGVTGTIRNPQNMGVSAKYAISTLQSFSGF